MKFIIIFYIFIFNGHAAFEEIKCDNNLKNFIKKFNYRLEVRVENNECNFTVTPNSDGVNYRTYRFTPEGELDVNYHFDINSGKSLSQTTGSKSYYFIPKKRKMKFFQDTETGEIKVELINGGEIFLDGKTGMINTTKTKDFKIIQNSIATNASTNLRRALQISSPRFPVVTLPLRRGNTNRSKVDLPLSVEYNDKVCKIKAGNLFDYAVSCKKKSDCACPAPKDAKDFTYELSRCWYESSEIRNLAESSIDGNRFKTSSPEGIYHILNESCGSENIFPKPAGYDEYVKSYQAPVKQSPKKVQGARSLKIIQLSQRFDSDPNVDPIQVADSVSEETESENSEQRELTEVFKSEAPKLSNGPSTDAVPETAALPEGIASLDDLPKDCTSKLKEYFDDDANKDLVNKYIKLQSKISLYRISWALLKISQDNTENTEKTIQTLLKNRNPDLHQKFIENTEITPNQNLIEMMGILKEESKKVDPNENDKPYYIKFSDVKMVQLLNAAEKKFGNSLGDGVMNFTSIINTTMRNSLDKKDENLSFSQKYIEKMIKESSEFQNTVQQYLAEHNCIKAFQFDSCIQNKNEDFDLTQTLQDNQVILDKIFEQQFEKEQELKENFKWNTFWLTVR